VNEEGRGEEGKSEGGEEYIYSLPIACQAGAAKMFAQKIFPMARAKGVRPFERPEWR